MPAKVVVRRPQVVFEARDVEGRLRLSFLVPERGSTRLTEKFSLELAGEDIDYFAGMLLDREVTDPSGKVSLEEPYPYVVSVKWDGNHRILALLSWEDRKPVARIRLSPLEARKVGRLAERIILVEHVLHRIHPSIEGIFKRIEGLEVVFKKFIKKLAEMA